MIEVNRKKDAQTLTHVIVISEKIQRKENKHSG